MGARRRRLDQSAQDPTDQSVGICGGIRLADRRLPTGNEVDHGLPIGSGDATKDGQRHAATQDVFNRTGHFVRYRMPQFRPTARRHGPHPTGLGGMVAQSLEETGDPDAVTACTGVRGFGVQAKPHPLRDGVGQPARPFP